MATVFHREAPASSHALSGLRAAVIISLLLISQTAMGLTPQGTAKDEDCREGRIRINNFRFKFDPGDGIKSPLAVQAFFAHMDIANAEKEEKGSADAWQIAYSRDFQWNKDTTIVPYLSWKESRDPKKITTFSIQPDFFCHALVLNNSCYGTFDFSVSRRESEIYAVRGNKDLQPASITFEKAKNWKTDKNRIRFVTSSFCPGEVGGPRVGVFDWIRIDFPDGELPKSKVPLRNIVVNLEDIRDGKPLLIDDFDLGNPRFDAPQIDFLRKKIKKYLEANSIVIRERALAEDHQ